MGTTTKGQGHHCFSNSCFHWGLCVGVLLVSVAAVTSNKADKDVSKTEVVMQCAKTQEGLRHQVIHCLAKGERFFKKYFKRYDSPKFSRCREYKAFGKCINNLIQSCPDALDILPSEWKTARKLMNCACNHGEQHKRGSECAASLNCMEEELNMVFSERCDAIYQNNLKQQTLDHCHFLTEYILCTEGVVRSACGDDVGSLLYLAHKVAAWNTYQCDVSRWDGFQGFQYNTACPRNLSQSMDRCMEKSLTAKVLRFKEENDLIPDENSEAVQLACSAYKNYMSCLTPLNDSCPAGVQAALEHKNTLRIYLMKMDFYCHANNTEFLSNLACYQDVVDKDLLNSCGSVWTRIQDALQNMTAFKYYCTESSQDTLDLKTELDNLRQCYESVIIQQCSSSAGVMMSKLIHRVFQDPLYLRLEYKPDCKLHTMESLGNRKSPQQHHHRGHHRHRHKERKKKDHGEDEEVVRTGHSFQKGSAVRIQTGSQCISLTVLLLWLHWSVFYWTVT